MSWRCFCTFYPKRPFDDSWHPRWCFFFFFFCQFPCRRLSTQNSLHIFFPPLSQAGIFFLIKAFFLVHEPVISEGSRGISFILPRVIRGPHREPHDWSLCQICSSFHPRGRRKIKDAPDLRPKRGSSANGVIRRFIWRSRNPSRARAAIWGSPDEYSRRACCWMTRQFPFPRPFTSRLKPDHELNNF